MFRFGMVYSCEGWLRRLTCLTVSEVHYTNRDTGSVLGKAGIICGRRWERSTFSSANAWLEGAALAVAEATKLMFLR